MLPYACCGLHFTDSAACVLSFYHSTPLQIGAAIRISGAATRDLSSQRQQQRPILTMNAGDNPGQPPAPPTLHSLRPHKLRRFSGEEGDAAEDFVRETKLFLELGPMVDPAAAAWLLGALEGRAKQEMLSVSLALRLTVSSTTNCATERDHAGLRLREPNFILLCFAHAPRYRVYNTSFRRRGVVCYNDYQLR